MVQHKHAGGPLRSVPGGEAKEYERRRGGGKRQESTRQALDAKRDLIRTRSPR